MFGKINLYVIKMKLQLLPPLFKLFNKSTFLSSLNQNTCPVLDAEEIKKQEQKEAIERMYPETFNRNVSDHIYDEARSYAPPCHPLLS